MVATNGQFYGSPSKRDGLDFFHSAEAYCSQRQKKNKWKKKLPLNVASYAAQYTHIYMYPETDVGNQISTVGLGAILRDGFWHLLTPHTSERVFFWRPNLMKMPKVVTVQQEKTFEEKQEGRRGAGEVESSERSRKTIVHPLTSCQLQLDLYCETKFIPTEPGTFRLSLSLSVHAHVCGGKVKLKWYEAILACASPPSTWVGKCVLNATYSRFINLISVPVSWKWKWITLTSS